MATIRRGIDADCPHRVVIVVVVVQTYRLQDTWACNIVGCSAEPYYSRPRLAFGAGGVLKLTPFSMAAPFGISSIDR
jgi:hypothetical protein